MTDRVELLAALPEARQCVDGDTIARSIGISKAALYGLIREGHWTRPLKFGRRSVWPMAETYRLLDSFLTNDPEMRRRMVDKIHAERHRAAERAMEQEA